MMWFNKKEVKTTKLYKRIERLCNLLEELKVERNLRTLNFLVEQKYASNLGERVFTINRIINSSSEFHYDVFFGEIKNDPSYLIPREKTIFLLKVDKYETKLLPYPINLSAREIDLAILEFENYIEKIYNEHKVKIKELEG